MTLVTAEELESRQRADGSFGRPAAPQHRVVSTILAARSLQEAGLHDHPSLTPALDFVLRTALIDGGVSIDGRRDGVLSCYTGMVARLLVGAGRLDHATPVLEWIVRYQPVAFGGVDYHQPDGPMWGTYLRTRYGGCMADSTCLLGLVPAMSALHAAHLAGTTLPVEPQLSAMRQLLTDRRLIFARDGSIMPLAGRTKLDPDGARWLAPAFPLDHVPDLVEVAQLAVDLGVPDDAMEEVRTMIESWRLPAGDWPMVGTRAIRDAYRPEPVDRRHPSELITRRVAALGPTAA